MFADFNDRAISLAPDPIFLHRNNEPDITVGRAGQTSKTADKTTGAEDRVEFSQLTNVTPCPFCSPFMYKMVNKCS